MKKKKWKQKYIPVTKKVKVLICLNKVNWTMDTPHLYIFIGSKLIYDENSPHHPHTVEGSLKSRVNRSHKTLYEGWPLYIWYLMYFFQTNRWHIFLEKYLIYYKKIK